jgi:hypothetical protein
MNDFTKDELGLILDAFHYAKDSACWTKYHDEPVLINKIQSMIDDYCENECAPNNNFLDKLCGACRKLIG